jgi:hypothetical protein
VNGSIFSNLDLDEFNSVRLRKNFVVSNISFVANENVRRMKVGAGACAGGAGVR